MKNGDYTRVEPLFLPPTEGWTFQLSTHLKTMSTVHLHTYSH